MEKRQYVVGTFLACVLSYPGKTGSTMGFQAGRALLPPHLLKLYRRRLARCHPHLVWHRFDGFLERQGLVFCFEAGEFEAAFFRAQFEAFAFLCLERLGGSLSCRGAKPLAIFAPFNKEAAARVTLDASLDVPLEGDVRPTLRGLNSPQDVDLCHSATPLKKWTLLWTLSVARVNKLMKIKCLWQPDL